MQIKDSIGRFFELEYNIIHVLLTGWFLPMPPAMAALSALIVAENRKPKPKRKHEMQYLYRPIPHSYSAYVKKRLWYFGVLHGLYLPLGAKTPINSMQLFVIWDYWLVKKITAHDLRNFWKMAIIEQAMNKRMYDIASRHQINGKKSILR